MIVECPNCGEVFNGEVVGYVCQECGEECCHDAPKYLNEDGSAE